MQKSYQRTDHTPNSSSIHITTQNWTLDNLISSASNFCPVPRVSAGTNISDLVSRIMQCEADGVPLIIEGWHERPEWPTSLFDLSWLVERHGSQIIEARNIHGERDDMKLSLSEFIDLSRAAPRFAIETETERLYGKDIDCPPKWEEWLANKFILDSVRPHGPADVLPASVQTLMCYIGISDTFTPCHKDLCASTGQNLMCYTENGGSSFWFMTKNAAAPDVAKHFHTLGQELDWESHVTTVEEFAEFPCDVYIAEQKLGDLVIVPPRSCHQVINRGGITIKTSWSRMTIQGLQIALYHELPIYRRVCRPEVYRVKFTIYQTMVTRSETIESEMELYFQLLRSATVPTMREMDTKIRGLSKELHQLLTLFDEILQQEYCRGHENLPHLGTGSFIQHSGRTCDFCGADVFQSFFDCSSCIRQDDNLERPQLGDGLVICTACYVEGRTCRCGDMRIAQCGKLGDLLNDRNKAAQTIRKAFSVGLSDHEPKIIHDSFYEAPSLPLFNAAKFLFDTRKRTKTNPLKVERKCRIRTYQSHSVTYISSLTCKKCHCSRCFAHILQLGIHASEAILSYSADIEHSAWHGLHIQGGKDYQSILKELMHAMSTGRHWNLEDRLVYAATNFSTVRPLDQHTSLGFYDKLPLLIHAVGAETSALYTQPPSKNEDGSIYTSSHRSKTEESQRCVETMDCVLISSRSKRRRERTRRERETKRAKLALPPAPSKQTFLTDDPLFVPSPTPSEYNDSEDLSGPSKNLTSKQGWRRVLSSSSSSSSSEDSPRRPKTVPTSESGSNLPLTIKKPGLCYSNRKPMRNLQSTSVRADDRMAVRANTTHPKVLSLAGPPSSQLNPPNRAVTSNIESQALSTLRDQLNQVLRENRDIRDQSHRQGRQLKSIGERMKLADNRVMHSAQEMKKLHEENRELRSQVQYLTHMSEDPQFVSSALEKSLWWSNQVEHLKKEVNKYIQDQLNSKKQETHEYCRNLLDEALKPIQETRLITESGILTALNTIVARLGETARVERLPPSTMDNCGSMSGHLDNAPLSVRSVPWDTSGQGVEVSRPPLDEHGYGQPPPFVNRYNYRSPQAVECSAQSFVKDDAQSKKPGAEPHEQADSREGKSAYVASYRPRDPRQRLTGRFGTDNTHSGFYHSRGEKRLHGRSHDPSASSVTRERRFEDDDYRDE